MKRRVVQHGPSTLILSLPSKWVKKYGVSKGDELEVEEKGSALTVYSSKNQEKLSTEINLQDYPLMAQRILHGLYKKGYDEVKINYSRLETLETIQKMLYEEIIGFEITEQKDGYCVIKTIAGVYDSEFDTMLKRIFNQLLVMNEGIVEIFEKKENSMLPRVRFLEKNNNKYTGFCRRILNKGGISISQAESNYLYCCLEELERIADQYKYLCDFLIDKGLYQIDKKTIKIFKQVQELLNLTQTLFFSYNINKINKIYNLRKKIIKECFELYESLSKKDIMILEYAKNITQKSANLLSFKVQIKI